MAGDPGGSVAFGDEGQRFTGVRIIVAEARVGYAGSVAVSARLPDIGGVVSFELGRLRLPRPRSAADAVQKEDRRGIRWAAYV
jgi:hypothetical protein